MQNRQAIQVHGADIQQKKLTFKSEQLMQSTIVNIAAILKVSIQQEFSNIAQDGSCRRFDLVISIDGKYYVVELKNRSINSEDFVECLVRRQYVNSCKHLFGNSFAGFLFVGSDCSVSNDDVKYWQSAFNCNIATPNFAQFSLWLVRKSRESIKTLHDRAIFPSRLYRLYADYGKCSGGTFNKDWLDKELSKGV
jgi:hypothetical protein